MLLVVDCKYQLEARGLRIATYGDIGRAAFGRYGQVLVNVALVVSQTGFSVACTSWLLVNVCGSNGRATPQADSVRVRDAFDRHHLHRDERALVL